MGAQFQKFVRLVVTVTTSGTPVQVNSGNPLYVRSFICQAWYQNTGIILLGDSAANAAATKAHALLAGAVYANQGDNYHARNLQFDLSQLWVSADADAQKLMITYMVEQLNQ